MSGFDQSGASANQTIEAGIADDDVFGLLISDGNFAPAGKRPFKWHALVQFAREKYETYQGMLPNRSDRKRSYASFMSGPPKRVAQCKEEEVSFACMGDDNRLISVFFTVFVPAGEKQAWLPGHLPKKYPGSTGGQWGKHFELDKSFERVEKESSQRSLLETLKTLRQPAEACVYVGAATGGAAAWLRVSQNRSDGDFFGQFFSYYGVIKRSMSPELEVDAASENGVSSDEQE
jgi:hypothetical protein